jgi:hypothetical protein
MPHHITFRQAQRLSFVSATDALYFWAQQLSNSYMVWVVRLAQASQIQVTFHHLHHSHSPGFLPLSQRPLRSVRHLSGRGRCIRV